MQVDSTTDKRVAGHCVAPYVMTLVLLVVPLSACVPFVENVWQPEHTGSHSPPTEGNCAMGGARRIVIPIENGIELTVYPARVKLDPTISLVFNIPADGSARFLSSVAVLESKGGASSVRLMYRLPSPTGKREIIAEGFTMLGSHYQRYAFELEPTLRGPDSFTLSLPELYVGTHSVGIIHITFRERSAAGLSMMCS
jgi:hypothetical protein